MSKNPVDDILNELNEIKERTGDGSSDLDGSFGSGKAVFGENEIFESVDDLRERITEDEREDKEAHEQGRKRIYLQTQFVLSDGEILETLKRANIYKTQGKRSVIYTVIMAVAAVGFFLSCIYGNNYNWLLFSILCVVVIAAIWLIPIFHLKKLARENSTGEAIEIEITNEDITQKTGDKEWIIPLDKSGTLEIGDEVLIIRTYHGQMFAIPKRSIEREIYKKILQILKNGTEPYDD